MATREERLDYIDHIHRITQFREWLDTNVLWPAVPDTIVRPLREQLIKAEEILAAKVYTSGDINKLAAMQKIK